MKFSIKFSHTWGSISSIMARIFSLSSWMESRRVKSDDLGGQLYSPFREITRPGNFSWKRPMVLPLVWYVVPSCLGKNIVHIHIFQFWPWKFINHGSIAQSIHRNSRSSFIFHIMSYKSNIRSCSCTTDTSSILHITNLSQQLKFLHQFHNSWPRRHFTRSEKTFNFTNCFSKIFIILVVNFNNFNALLKCLSFHFY